jgi:serine phosphatase RsbU (regulator of sigma subunit)
MERLKIKAGYIPASLIGGDFYDFVKTSEHTISCIIADVTGHGVPAAIEAAMLKIAYTQTISISDSPGEVLKNINTSLVGKYKNQLLTAATVYFDLQKGLIKIANAGHPGLYLMRKSDSTIQVLRPQGKLIGFSNDVFFIEESHSLQAGDRILLFTDGLWDMWEKDNSNQSFPKFKMPTQTSDGSGEMELLDWLGKNRDSNFDSLFESIENTIRLQKLTSTADDDITFILFEVQTSA